MSPLGPLLVLVATLAPWTPDLAPPGMKTVPTSIVIELADEVADRRFAISPGGGGMRVVEPGERIGMGSMPRVRLYALAAGEELPAGSEWHPPLTEEWPVDRPTAELPVRRATNVTSISPIARVIHTVRVTGIDGETIRFEVVGTARFDAQGEPIDENAFRLLWIALGSIGAVGLLLLSRRRRRAGTEVST